MASTSRKDGSKEICVIVASDALEDGMKSVSKSHSCVNAGFGQRMKLSL